MNEGERPFGELLQRGHSPRRDDIRAAGIGDGRCGFGVELPGGFEARLVSVVVSGTPTHLCNSPIAIPARPALQGCFDNFHGMSAHGWALDSRRPGQPVVVEAVSMDGRVFGSAAAGLFRGDLLDAGLRGPAIGTALRAAHAAALDGAAADRETQLAVALGTAG